METAGEELSRLRAVNAHLKQLLVSRYTQAAQRSVASPAAYTMIADKAKFAFSSAVRWLKSLFQTSAGSLAPVLKMTSAIFDEQTALDKDDVLDHVFSFVGGGDHLYTGGVCRNWRGRYMQYCAQSSGSDCDDKLVTRHRSVLMTESRLQLALISGLSVKDWIISYWDQAELICIHSLEPEQVMALLRAHGVPWDSMLCDCAADNNKLRLLQWLHANSCPWDEHDVLLYASRTGSVAMLEWLSTVTAPCSCELKNGMLVKAGCHNELAVVQWLKAHGAEWPQSLCGREFENGVETNFCWPVAVVQWAVACGSGWPAWKCEKFTADNYDSDRIKRRATELFEWAHANGCPCTCEHAQQQQQQQQEP
jgi:hypothetical protein